MDKVLLLSIALQDRKSTYMARNMPVTGLCQAAIKGCQIFLGTYMIPKPEKIIK
jgi:hypothetical protein